ncbi:MAG: hypothetical protein LBC75_02605 [Fibromonadaceae bacterium]|jgi:hypothetical protein|nr:hypothetical protein [Fibromonadaceae bacterium]
MTTDKESEGLTPELAAKGHWNETAPQPPEPTKKEPEPPKEPEQPKPEPQKEEPAKEPEKPSAEDDKLSRRKARVNALIAKRDATLAKLKIAGDDKSLEAVHKARLEEQEAEAIEAIEDAQKEYEANFKEAFPDEKIRERLFQYAEKYSPKIIENDNDFAEWWVEYPHHFETMNSLYSYFAEDGPAALEKFLNNTTFDKKEIVEAIWNNLSNPKPAEAAKPETPPKPDTANGTPLPKVEGDSPKPSASDDMQAIYDQNRANYLRSIGK